MENVWGSSFKFVLTANGNVLFPRYVRVCRQRYGRLDSCRWTVYVADWNYVCNKRHLFTRTTQMQRYNSLIIETLKLLKRTHTCMHARTHVRTYAHTHTGTHAHMHTHLLTNQVLLIIACYCVWHRTSMNIFHKEFLLLWAYTRIRVYITFILSHRVP